MNPRPRAGLSFPDRRSLIACVLLGLLPIGSVQAGNVSNLIYVDTDSGAAELPGQCTLKSALRAALHGLPSGSCTVPSPGMTPEIHLPANAEIVIDDSIGIGLNGEFAANSPFVAAEAEGRGLVIHGHGATIRRAGAACDPTTPDPQVDVGFLLLFAQSGPVSMESVRLQNFCNTLSAFGGGALYAEASQISLDRVQLIGNRALNAGGGADLIAPLIRLVDTQVQGNRVFTGGRDREGSGLRLIQSTAEAGQAVGVQIERSSFIDNAVVGAASLGMGAALHVAVRSGLELDNGTFLDNVGYTVGALSLVRLSNDASIEAVLRHNTFLRNSSISFSTLRIQAPVRLSNNLLLAGPGTACGFENGFTLSSTNMSNSTSCSGWQQVPSEGVLAPTFTNSGGAVSTLRLLPGSVAIDAALDCLAGAPSGPVDARGLSRPRDGDGNGSAECDVGATEYVRNRAPELSAPLQVSTLADTPIVFQAASGTALGISDPEAQQLPLEIELAVNGGSIRFGNEAGLDCSGGNGPGGGPLRRCVGSQTALNAALAGAQYTPPVGASGNYQLTLSTLDFGNGGDDGAALGNQRTVAIEVLPRTPVITLTPANVDFGVVVVGEQASTRVELHNSGNAGLILQALELLGEPIFSLLASDCPAAPQSLAAGARCNLDFGFAPIAEGPQQGALNIVSNAPGLTQLILLDGSGQSPRVFGNGFESDDR